VKKGWRPAGGVLLSADVVDAAASAIPERSGPASSTSWLSAVAGRVGERVGELVVVALVASVYAIQLVRILIADRSALVQGMPDDAFYYLEIGQRAAHGQGVTFDGVNATNGFHPLWQVIVTGLAKLTGGGDALMRSALVTGLVLGLAGTLLLALVVRRAFGNAPALLALLVASHMPTAIGDAANGMEGAIVIMCVALLVLAFARLDDVRRKRDALFLGAACGLLVLARLDFITVVWIAPVFAAWRLRSLRAAAWTAVGALVCAPAFLWNLLTFGHLLSVSGTVKQHNVSAFVTSEFGSRLSLGYLRFVWNLLVDDATMLWHNATWTSTSSSAVTTAVNLGYLVLCVIGAVVLLRRRRVGLQNGAAIALAAGLAMLAAKAVVDVVFSPFWIGSWYAAAQRTAAAMLVGVLLWFALQPLRARLSRMRWLPAAAVALVFLPLNYGNVASARTMAVDGHNWQGADLQAADWIVQSGPPGRYGSPDAGVLGFFTDGSHASIANLDGLVESFAYADELATGVAPLQRYRSLGVEFLVGRRELNSPDVPSCGRVLWSSPEGVVYGGGLDSPQVTSVPVRVWDLRACMSAG
jgi:hypothetical protein